MSFEEWYEKNKEALTACTIITALRRAWQAGNTSAETKVYKELVRYRMIHGLKDRRV